MNLDYAREFAQLHVPGSPLILYNVWDAGSAQAVERAGAKAIRWSEPMSFIRLTSR